MGEYNVNSSEPMGGSYQAEGYGTTGNGGTEFGATGNTITNATKKNVPANVSVWSKVKKFLCQEVVVELTPRQEKAFKEINDFWHQDVTWKSFKEFWLQEIEITL